MKAVLLSLLVVYLLFSLYQALTGISARDRSAVWALSMALQTALFISAAYIAFGAGVFSRALLSPFGIGFGLLGGHLIFGLSLLITHRSPGDTLSHFFDFNGVWNFIVEHPFILSRFVFVALSEEIIWRAAAQPFLVESLGLPLGLSIIALCFVLAHDHIFRNSVLVTVEFLAFALLLGAVYHWTGSLILVILVHAFRDLEITYIEYIVKVHELGDEEKASKEIDRQYLPGLRERHE